MRALESDHGPAWRHVCARGARAWLEIIAEGVRDGGDLFGARLPGLAVPALVIHGRRDPRTEPGELEAILAALPRAEVALLDAGHAPHVGGASGQRCVELAAEFLAENPW